LPLLKEVGTGFSSTATFTFASCSRGVVVMETLLSLDKRANAKYSVESILDINIMSDETPEYQAFDQPFLLSIIVSGLSLFRGG
jgi:hypothetical protein